MPRAVTGEIAGRKLLPFTLDWLDPSNITPSHHSVEQVQSSAQLMISHRHILERCTVHLGRGETEAFPELFLGVDWRHAGSSFLSQFS